MLLSCSPCNARRRYCDRMYSIRSIFTKTYRLPTCLPAQCQAWPFPGALWGESSATRRPDPGSGCQDCVRLNGSSFSNLDALSPVITLENWSNRARFRFLRRSDVLGRVCRESCALSAWVEYISHPSCIDEYRHLRRANRQRLPMLDIRIGQQIAPPVFSAITGWRQANSVLA